MPAAAAKLARRWLDAEERAATARLVPHFERLAGARRYWEKD
jgi:hypothetical protein